MKYYRMITFSLLLSFLGLFSWQFFQQEQEERVLATVSVDQKKIDESYQAPFNLVYHFYESIEKNDWDKVKSFVTPVWWGEMHRLGYKQKWQKMVQDDPSIRFVMFLVAGQKIDIDNNFAWVMGKVDWVSSRQIMDDENETVFFIKDKNNEWKISSIRMNIPVETVEDFYQTINQGNFDQIPSFLTKGQWNKIDKGEVIDSLKSDWKNNQTGVYCVFYLHDFGINQNEAWVKGDVLWNPLSSKVRETQVTLFLTNVNKGWKIDKITGHWEGEK